jgi:hypothetical protein
MEGHKIGKNKIDFNKALVVCNTKISDHAQRYAVCRGIKYIVWKYPEGNSLEKIIAEKKLYPITILKGLDIDTQVKLGDNGIVLLKQLVEMNPEEIARKARINKEKIRILSRKARELLL